MALTDWSKTASENDTAGSIDFSENMAPNKINDSGRQVMADVAADQENLPRYYAAGGTANALTVTTSWPVTAYSDGQQLTIKASAANTGAITLNVDGVGASNVLKLDGNSHASGDISTGDVFTVVRVGSEWQRTTPLAADATFLTDAQANATIASTKATEATASAETAATKATEATASAATAATKESESTASASTAATNATNSTTSASTASTKATEATTDASTTATKATEATASALTAATKATEATTSAGNIATQEDAVNASVAGNWGNISKLIADDADFVAHCGENDINPEWLDMCHGAWFDTHGPMPRHRKAVAHSDHIDIIDTTKSDTPIYATIARTGPAGVSFWRNDSSIDLVDVLLINQYLIFALNSGGATSNNGLCKINFHSGELTRYAASGGGGTGLTLDDLTSTTATFPTTFGASQELVSFNVNKIAATILPGAPRDEYGMLVPTIAVATAGGISVINNDGSVTDSLTTLSMDAVAFDADGRLYYGRDGTTGVWYADDYSSDGFGPANPYYAAGSTPSGSATAKTIMTTPDGKVYFGGSNATYDGLVIIDPDKDNDANTTHRKVKTDYATPEMTLSTIACLLASTTAGTFDNSELLPANVFSSVTGWSNEANWTFDTVNEKAVSDGGTGSIWRDADEISQGDHISITITVADYVAGSLGISFSNGAVTTDTMTANGTYTFVGIVTANDLIYIRGVGFDGSITALSYTKALPDHSGNGNDAQVNGSLTKTAVATGAELVWFGNFSAVNYAVQPYTADHDHGTGDFEIEGLISVKAGTGNADFYTRGSGTSAIAIFTGNGVLNFRTYSAGGANITLTDTGNDLRGTGGHHWLMRRVAGVAELYVDGVLKASIANTHDLTNAGASTEIGKNCADLEGLAMIKPSTSVRTAEQILVDANRLLGWLREDAKVTLQGDSDQVNDSAYDPVTNTLLVPTEGGGVTVFDATKRVVVEHITSASTGGLLANDNIRSVSAYNGTYAITDSTGKTYYHEPAVSIRGNRWFGGFWPKLRAFMARLSITETLLKIFYLNVEIENDLKVGGKVNLPVYTTLPTDAVEGDEIWYDDSGTLKKLYYDDADDWRVIATLGATVT